MYRFDWIVLAELVVSAYMQALEDSLKIMEDMSIKLDPNDMKQLSEVVSSVIETKFVSRWGQMISDMAIKAGYPKFSPKMFSIFSYWPPWPQRKEIGEDLKFFWMFLSDSICSFLSLAVVS